MVWMLPSRFLDGNVTRVDGLHLGHGEPGVGDLLGQLAVGSLGRVKKSARLLHFSIESGSLSLRDSNLFTDLLSGSSLVLEALDGFTELSLVSLESLQTFSIGLVGLVKTNLKLIYVSLKLLLDSQCFSLRLLLSLQRNIQRFHSTGVIFASIIELLFLLSNSSINVRSDLLELHGGSENLVLLLLKSALSLLKGSLEFLLLLLETTSLFVKIVDGASTIAKLIKKILDLISKILVLSLDNVKLLGSFIIGSLQSKQLRTVVSSLVLRSLNLQDDVIGLVLPFSMNLLKVLAPLLSDESSSMNSLIVHGHLLQLGVESVPGFLNVGDLCLQRVHSLFSLNNSGLELGSAGLQLLESSHTLGLEARPPKLNLCSSLGQGLHGNRLPDIFILNLLPEVGEVGGHGLELGQEAGTILGLGISKRLHVLQLGGHG